MALSNAERQRRHRAKARGTSSRVDLKLPFEIAIKLDYLAQHWQCTKTEALGRMLLDTGTEKVTPSPGTMPKVTRYTVTTRLIAPRTMGTSAPRRTISRHCSRFRRWEIGYFSPDLDAPIRNLGLKDLTRMLINLPRPVSNLCWRLVIVAINANDSCRYRLNHGERTSTGCCRALELEKLGRQAKAPVPG